MIVPERGPERDDRTLTAKRDRGLLPSVVLQPAYDRFGVHTTDAQLVMV